jgi:heat shock protein HslJ
MKKTTVITLSAALVFCFCLCLCLCLSGCSDALSLGKDKDYKADQKELCQSWQLIGYGTETDFHTIAEEYRTTSETYGSRFFLVFSANGTFTGRESVNRIFGDYTCRGAQIKIENLVSTEIYDAKGAEESEAFLRRLMTATSYGIKDTRQLRLYYTADEFLYFEAPEPR